MEVSVNQGGGTFRNNVDWKDKKESCKLVAVQDVNGDGKPDLVCKETDEGREGMYTYLGVR